MGILDNQFDPTSFQASDAATPGWLRFTLPPPAPSAGFADAGQSLANAAPAPGSLAANPFSALFNGLGNVFAPAGAQSPNGPGAGPGLGDRANAAVMNFLNGHALLPAISGAITGLTSGQRTDPAGIMQQARADAMRRLLAAAPQSSSTAAPAPVSTAATGIRPAAMPGTGSPAPALPAVPSWPQGGGKLPDGITATGPNGHRIMLRNDVWIDLQTGQPVRR